MFHFLTDVTLQFLSKLTIHHSKYGWLAVGSFRCCLLTGNNQQVWTTFLRSSTSLRWLKTLEMSLASMPNSFHLAAVFLYERMLYAVRCLKSNEDMILALAGQFKQLSHEPEKFR